MHARTKFLTESFLLFIQRHFVTSIRPAVSFPPTPVDSALLIRIATILYQQQYSPDKTLTNHLQKLQISSYPLPFLHELFLQTCNQFPYSWRPVYRFHRFLLSEASTTFSHSPVSAAKMLSVFGKAKNMDLLWSTFLDFAASRLLSPSSIRFATVSLGDAREIKKCAEIFHVLRLHQEELYNVKMLNLVVETLCGERIVEVAQAVVQRLKTFITPDEATYRFLVIGFCRSGDLVEASTIWNKMIEEGLEPDLQSYEEIVVTMFKNNMLENAVTLFKLMRSSRLFDIGLPSYRVVIDWMCKEGRILYAFMLLAEMVKRGVGMDNSTLGMLVYGLLARRKVTEGYKVMNNIEEPDINVYHGLMKGLLRIKRASEAVQVFRLMIERGCEPIMHTYIMLLQGYLGKRGRKGTDPLVNFGSIFVGGLVKAGKTLQATKYVERMMWGGVKVPQFDYNKFLHCFSNEEGVIMFEEVGRRLNDVGLLDLADVFLAYGERMATRDRRRRAMGGLIA